MEGRKIQYRNRGFLYRLRLWAEFFFGAIIWFIILCLPLKIVVPLFMGIFGTLGPLVKANRRGLRNLERVYPEKTAEERQALMKKVWRNFAQVAVTFMKIQQLRPTLKQGENIIIRGKEVLEQVKASPQGAIFFSGHCATWEMARLAAFNEGLPVGMLYRAFNNPLVDRVIWRVLEMPNTPFFHKGTQGTRQMIQYLRKGGKVLILLDQKLSEGVSMPFMGHDAKTATAPAELALRFNLPLIPVIVRNLGYEKFEVEFYPPLPVEECQKAENPALALTLLVNETLGKFIHDRPEEWFWLHQRWK